MNRETIKAILIAIGVIFVLIESRKTYLFCKDMDKIKSGSKYIPNNYNTLEGFLLSKTGKHFSILSNNGITTVMLKDREIVKISNHGLKMDNDSILRAVISRI